MLQFARWFSTPAASAFANVAASIRSTELTLKPYHTSCTWCAVCLPASGCSGCGWWASGCRALMPLGGGGAGRASSPSSSRPSSDPRAADNWGQEGQKATTWEQTAHDRTCLCAIMSPHSRGGARGSGTCTMTALDRSMDLLLTGEDSLRAWASPWCLRPRD